MNDDTKKAADSEIQKLIDSAMEAQARFKKAPHLAISDAGHDPMMELRKIYLPDSIGKNPSKHCFFGLWADIEKLSNKGYAIVLNENRQPVRLNELVMCWKPIELAKASEKSAQQRATDLMKGVQGNFKNAPSNTTSGCDIPAPDRSGVSVEMMDVRAGGTSSS